jgi:hypothetical protein
LATYLLVQAFVCLAPTDGSILGLLPCHDVYQRFACVALYHSILVPDRLDASSRSRFSRLSCHPEGMRLHCPRSFITRVGYRWQNIRLCPSNNSHNSHSRDFVSHPNVVAFSCEAAALTTRSYTSFRAAASSAATPCWTAPSSETRRTSGNTRRTAIT